jgi:hypothetical protein
VQHAGALGYTARQHHQRPPVAHHLGVESEPGDLRDDPRLVTGVARQQDLASLVGHADRLECRR